MDREEIRDEAKNIMDNFMSSMEGIEVEEEFLLHRDSEWREEGGGRETSQDFKQEFLSNAPSTDGEAILAEKGKWQK